MRGLIPSGDLMLEPGIVHLQTGTWADAAAGVRRDGRRAREVERDPLIAAYGPGKTRSTASAQGRANCSAARCRRNHPDRQHDGGHEHGRARACSFATATGC